VILGQIRISGRNSAGRVYNEKECPRRRVTLIPRRKAGVRKRRGRRRLGNVEKDGGGTIRDRQSDTNKKKINLASQKKTFLVWKRNPTLLDAQVSEFKSRRLKRPEKTGSEGSEGKRSGGGSQDLLNVVDRLELQRKV